MKNQALVRKYADGLVQALQDEREFESVGAEVEKAKQELLLEMEALKKELDARTAEIAKTIEKRILGE